MGRHLTHAEAMEEQQAVTVTTTVRVAQKPKRPSSLLVGNGSNSLSSLNIPIETPTNVMNQLDFNALLREPAKDEPEHGASRAWKSEHRRTFGISVMWSHNVSVDTGSELEFKWKIMTPSPYM